MIIPVACLNGQNLLVAKIVLLGNQIDALAARTEERGRCSSIATLIFSSSSQHLNTAACSASGLRRIISKAKNSRFLQRQRPLVDSVCRQES